MRRFSAVLASLRQRFGRTPRWTIAVLAAATIAVSFVVFTAVRHRKTNVPVPGVPYSELAAALDARQVRRLSVEDGGTRLVAELTALGARLVSLNPIRETLEEFFVKQVSSPEAMAPRGGGMVS